MIITCSKCHKSFKFNESILKSEISTIECYYCKHSLSVSTSYDTDLDQDNNYTDEQNLTNRHFEDQFYSDHLGMPSASAQHDQNAND